MRYHYTPIRMAVIRNADNTKCWGECVATTHCWWECKMIQTLWKTVWWFLTKLNIFLKKKKKLNIIYNLTG